jgi:uncharacterized membrane protein YtjA (UPF0391 family)
MIRAAISFFILGLLAMILGANNVAGFSIEIGKILLGVFLFLAVLSLLGHLFTGRSTKTLIAGFGVLLVSACCLAPVKSLNADDSTGAKVQKSADDASTSVKKGTRTAKRKVRKATGNDNIAKDAKDKVNDAGDDISNSAKKAKIDSK